LVDNRSEKSETATLLAEFSEDERVKVIRYNGRFNFSAINNYAATKAKGEYLLFLNNDTQVAADRWLESMIDLARMPRVGVVGAKLLYPDETIQHVGVMLGPNLAVHAFSGFRQTDPLFVTHCSAPRQWRAVTAACMLTRKELFVNMGGFDESQFAVAYNDVDYCLRLGAAGFATWVTPEAVLYHFESISRGKDLVPIFIRPIRYVKFRREQRALETRWGNEIASDPHYDAAFLRK
jgi:GT2 family glycosyltransferase